MLQRLAALVALAFVIVAGGVAPAMADKRVALVIGNSAYRKVSPLPNPVNDANAIGDLFRNAGFDDVQLANNLGVADLRKALRIFAEKAAGADIALVYYAGHGIEIGGHNYLIPVDAVLASDIDVEDEAVDLDRVLQLMEPAKRLKLVILDACRDNPFAQKIRRTVASRSIGRGLAQPDIQPSNTLVAFAAKAGSTALDGEGAHSPFTTALLRHLATPGLDLRIALGNVHDDVLIASNNAQEPFLYGAMGGGVLPLVPAKVEPPKPAVDPDASARADFDLAQRIGTIEAWDAFLAQHPSGFLANLAKAARQKLAEARPATADVPHVQETPKQQVAALPPAVTPKVDVPGKIGSDDGMPLPPAVTPKVDVPARNQSLYVLPADAALELKGGSMILSVAFSPDGRTIASAGREKPIKLWDAASGKLLKTLEGHGSGVKAVAFSPDGRTIASSGWDKAKLWDAASGKLLKTLEGSLQSVAFSPDGRTIATGGYKTLTLWDATSGKLLKTLKGHGEEVWSIAFSPDGGTIASGSKDKTIKLWDATSGQLLKTLEGHGNWVESVAFSPDGRTIASGSADGTIKLWDAASGQLAKTLEGHVDEIRAIAISPDGRMVASGTWGKTIKLWDTTSGELLKTLAGHGDAVEAVAFSPDGRTIASGSDDGTIKLWDTTRRVLLATLVADRSDWAAVAPDGRYVASGDIRKFVAIKRGDTSPPMDEFIAKNRRDSLADVLSAAR